MHLSLPGLRAVLSRPAGRSPQVEWVENVEPVQARPSRAGDYLSFTSRASRSQSPISRTSSDTNMITSEGITAIQACEAR